MGKGEWMICKKHGISVTGCSRFFECEKCGLATGVGLTDLGREWWDTLEALRVEYGIRPTNQKSILSSKRVAILVGEAYLETFRAREPKAIHLVPIVEREAYEMAMALGLQCDPLERERRVKPE